MECDAEYVGTRNDLLSQSYVECVERVAQQKSDGGLSFVLPQEVLEERERVWGQFFHKYDKEVSDDAELDINTMRPTVAEGDEETEEAEDEEEEEEEEDEDEDEEDDAEDEGSKEYDSKCRAPLRKQPALIQYWIDTGNPPYRLDGDDDDTETGSSLNEGEHSRSGRSAVPRESSEKPKSNTSRCSSVDTAAYILSNTNVTKKAEAMAIVEGAKSSEDRFVGRVSPLKEASAESSREADGAVALSPDNGQQARLSDFIVAAASRSPRQQSVKLSEILPELEEFDEMLRKSNSLGSPRTPSMNVIGGNSEVVRPAAAAAAAAAAVEPNERPAAGLFPVVGGRRFQNRRKLYTGRDSPVDLVVERPIGQVVGNVRHSLHPALDTSGAARVRTKRKRKRASHVSEMNSQDGNTSQQSDQPVGKENSKSDARYTDFFESLGLTPSKMIAGKPRVRRPIAKRSRTIEKRDPPRNSKDAAAPLEHSIESSFKESVNNSQTEDSVTSPVTRDKNLDVNERKRVHCGEKTLRVRIERLSDECLARYRRKIPPQTGHKELESNESRICSASSGKSSGKKVRRLNQEKIEVLTTATHDSDSSTILICACSETENVAKCDGDAPIFSKTESRTKRTSSRLRGPKLSANAATDGVKYVTTKKLDDNLPETFVQLEKLRIPDLQKTAGNSGNSMIQFKTSLGPNSPSKNGNKSDLLGSKASEPVAVGKRIFGAANGCETNEKSRPQFRATRSRCTLGILVPSDDEEDTFAKLISEIGSKPSSTSVNDKRNNNSSNGNDHGKNGIKISQSQFAIFASSDEDDDVETRQNQRRTRHLVVSRNQKKRREKRKKTDDDLVQETNNDRKLPNEKIARDEEEAEADRRTTRGSKSRSETTRVSFPASKDEEIEDSEPRVNSNVVGRSTRHNNSSVFELSKNQLPAKDLFRCESMDTKNLPAWIDGDLDLNDENPDTGGALKIVDRSEESESRSTFRPPRDVKRVVRVSLSSRFQTRLHSDSDTEFEGLRFSLPGRHRKRGSEEEEERNDAENAKSKGSAGTPRNKSKIEEILRTSPRRSFKDSATSIRETSERKLKSRGRNLFDGGSKSAEKDDNCVRNDAMDVETEIVRASPRQSSKDLSTRLREVRERKSKKREKNVVDDGSKSAEDGDNCFQNEAMNVETSVKNGILSLDELPADGTKNSPVKGKKKRRGQSSLELRSRKISTKSEPLKNRSPVAKRRNGASRVSSPVKKKKKKDDVRRTRILGKPTEWVSDDDTDSNDNKIGPANTKRGKSTERSNDSRRSTKNLFSTSANVVEDVDLLFDVGAKPRGNKNAVVIPRLNFASTKNHESVDSRGSSSTMSFRTRLRSDTEDDGES